MRARHVLLAGALVGTLAPALAQDSGDHASPWPFTLRATGAYPVRQDSSQWLGSNLIGARVVSAGNESIGRVANLIVNDNGAVEAVVIAVGGVFGMGAKDVAVTYSSLNIVRNKTGDTIDRVVLAATKNDLLHAAEFKSLRRQTAEAQAKW
jgi:hypothetical protein